MLQKWSLNISYDREILILFKFILIVSKSGRKGARKYYLFLVFQGSFDIK